MFDDSCSDIAYCHEMLTGGLQMGGEHAGVACVAQEILDGLAEATVAQTSFRRAMVSLYDRPITPHSNHARVIACGVRGLDEEDQDIVRRQLAEGSEVNGTCFDTKYLIGSSYYIREGGPRSGLGLRVESRRRFLNPGGWRRHDVLLTPMRSEEGYIGMISVDDPRDGALPDRSTLRALEQLAQLGTVCLCGEATQRERGPVRKDELFAALAEHCMAGFLVTRDERVEYVNQRVVDLFGYAREELQVLYPWWQLIHPEDRQQLTRGGTQRRGVRARAVHKDGSSVWVLVRSYVLDFGAQSAHLVDLWDIREQVETEGALKERALRDPLTGLFNRQYFEETIRTELKRAERYGRSFTLVMADLKGFKRVNDRLGHTEGDHVLRSVAGVLRDTLRGSDWLVRYGGDEFLIVLPETASPVDVVLQRLQSSVERWSSEHLPGIRISVDMGSATWSPGCGRSIGDLLNVADAEMYTAKSAGRDT